MANTNNSWYQYPNKTDSESITGLFNYVNNQVEGLLFPVILVAVWFISFIAVFSSSGSSKDSASRAFTFASFFCSVLSIPLAITGLLSTKIMFVFFIMTAFGALLLKLNSPTVD